MANTRHTLSSRWPPKGGAFAQTYWLSISEFSCLSCRVDGLRAHPAKKWCSCVNPPTLSPCWPTVCQLLLRSHGVDKPFLPKAWHGSLLKLDQGEKVRVSWLTTKRCRPPFMASLVVFSASHARSQIAASNLFRSKERRWASAPQKKSKRRKITARHVLCVR